jgi:hypothetical protein
MIEFGGIREILNTNCDSEMRAGTAYRNRGNRPAGSG